MKKAILLVLTAVIMFTLAGCGYGSNDVTNQVKSITQSENEYVLGVKYGHSDLYPDITYEEAFDYFFGSPTWTHFVGSRDNDDTDYEVVEFTGDCMYYDKEVKALIQFTMSEDEKTFEATYLSYNDIPQTDQELVGLLDKVFTEYQEAQKMESNKATPND